jgi:hypothetical protein
LARIRRPYAWLPNELSLIPKVSGGQPRLILCDAGPVLSLPERLQSLFLCVSPSAHGRQRRVSRGWPETSCDDRDVHHRDVHHRVGRE